MVKTSDEVRAKMKERVQTAGKYLKAGMDAAVDPLEILNRNPEESAKRHLAGVQESARRGNYQAGIKKALANDSWGKSKARAAAHFEERADDMVTNALQDYDGRSKCIENAQKAIANMPTTTRAQRIARGNAYSNAVAAEFDKFYGRKA